MHQIIVIHGGDTFNTYEEYITFLKGWRIDFDDIRSKRTDWKDGLQAALGDGFEVIAPKMPNKLNAKYLEWKIWLEKFIPHLEPEVVLVGHSMGGIFLAKYLAENDFPKTIKGLFLVAAPYDEKDTDESLADFNFSGDLKKVGEQAQSIFLYQSADDPVVPFADFAKYQAALPHAVARQLEGRGHINQETFPELVADIKSL